MSGGTFMNAKKGQMPFLMLFGVGMIMAVAVACAHTETAGPLQEASTAGTDEISSIDRISPTDKTSETDTASSIEKTPPTEEPLFQKLESALPSGSTVTASYSDDYDKDSKLELFALVNMEQESSIEGSFAGQVWYADEFGARKLFDGNIYSDTAAIWDVGKQKLFYAEEGYGGSGSLSHVWSVREGTPYELGHAGEGLEYAGDLQFYTYPGAFDLLPDGTGHTWKRYYLHFDEETGMFKEYGGIPISEANLLKLKGASGILKEITDHGYKITDIFYRANGIININYQTKEYNLNITLTVRDGAVATEGTNSIEKPDLDGGGSYKAAIFEDIAAYPDSFPY
jgi:hypothetical protein